MKGAQLLARALRAQGVKWISTLCGHGLDEVYAACQRVGIRLIDVRNEQSAAYMAECWGRLSGQVGVCAVSSGVAHANAMTGVVNAYFDGAPMLLLTGAGARQTAGMGHFQDLDQVALAAPVCKYARVLDLPERIPAQVHEAFAAALGGRPGPVHLTFPMDVQEAQVEEGPLWPPAQRPGPMHPAPRQLEQAADLFARARRPLLVAGSGVYYARGEEALAQFAAAYAIPVVVPIWDRGTVSGGMPEYIGVIGAASGGPMLLEEADLVVLLGAPPDYRVGFLQTPPLAGEARLLRIDADAARLSQGRPADLSIQADPGAALEQLHETCAERQIDGFEAWLQTARQRRDEFQRQVVEGARRGGGLHALDLIEALREVLTPETVLIVDGGSIGQWFHQTLGRERYPGHWLTCGISGVVGYGIAGAMAARAGFANRPVILLSGDGSATFTLAELECAARQHLPFAMIVADDQSWGITATGHRRRYGEALSSTLGPVDFAAAAQAFGALGTQVSTRAELTEALRQGLREPLPALIHAPIAGGMPGE
ncbi:MAG: thiamine pyrophosphate-binding protein [Candidatus Latescibacteria bacterium]|nr:thiamine pyrophosphate-binding protein [Candidatus Latescibacterota bacterium]